MRINTCITSVRKISAAPRTLASAAGREFRPLRGWIKVVLPVPYRLILDKSCQVGPTLLPDVVPAKIPIMGPNELGGQKLDKLWEFVDSRKETLGDLFTAVIELQP